MINVNTNAELNKNNLEKSKTSQAWLITIFTIMLIVLAITAALQVYYKYHIIQAENSHVLISYDTYESYKSKHKIVLVLYFLDLLAILITMIVFTAKIKNPKAKKDSHLVLLICLSIFFPMICAVIWISLYPGAVKASRENPETIIGAEVKKTNSASHKNVSNNIGQSVEEKLAKLESLKSRGLVDDDDYKKIKNDIINSELK